MSEKTRIHNRLAILKAVGAIEMFSKKTQRDSITQLDKLSHRIVEAAKRRAPVRTGALRASGRVEKKSSTTRIIGFGGGGTGVNYAALVEYGGSAAGPRPFLRPAFMAVKATYKPALIKDMKVSWTVASRIGSTL